MSPLTIYKASAGSGKTFRLTLGYLNLSFRDPQVYRHILAVTFTNKAASEMKSRILDRLYNLSRLKEGMTSGDLELLKETTGLSSRQIIERAGELLTRILNDYSRFSVGTIDRFFQGVIRAFTREIGLPSGFNLEIDPDRILGEAVDRLFRELGEDNDLLRWMLQFAESRIEESKGWNFRDEILSLGKELFSESYQALVPYKDPGTDRESLKAFIDFIQNYKDEKHRSIRTIAENALKKMSAAGYTPDDFRMKSRGPAALLERASTGWTDKLTNQQKEAIDDLFKWISPKETDQGKIRLVETVLMQAMAGIYERTILLNSAVEISQNIFSLGILADITKKLWEITDEKGLFLLSDTTRFIKGLIGSNPAPFIYEKTGSFIDHIMLDEFQDTSVFQWENFRPLLEHTLSTGKENIVVGDIKQSIYRWRNSDWKILADVVHRSFPGHPITELPLDENWRSRELLIRFNNTLFSNAPEIIRNIIGQELQDSLVTDSFRERWTGLLDTAYAGVVQKIPMKSAGSGGYIRAEVLDEEDEGFQEQALKRLPVWIRELQDAGYRAGDIAILVRKNDEGAKVADKLMEQMRDSKDSNYNFNFVSNDSLLLYRNTAVRFIVCLLKYLLNSNDQLNNISAIYFHRKLFPGEPGDLAEALYPGITPERELGVPFTSRSSELRRMPLFELTETLIDMFSLESRPSNLPYIQAFQEIILGLQQDDPGSLHDFIGFWEEHGYKKSIKLSDDQDALRIITIHKAKGLQFKVVVIPFCSWELTNTGSRNNSTIMWCSTEGTVFDKLPYIPLKFRLSVADTIFAPYYFEELIMGYVDNLNMLYVAFTRAAEAMIIGLPAFDPDVKPKSSGQLILQAAGITSQSTSSHPDAPGDLTDTRLTMDLAAVTGKTGFEIGTLHPVDSDTEQQTDVWRLNTYPVKFRNDHIRLRLKSTAHYADSGDPGTGHLDFGNIMHGIFSLIRSTSDVDRAVARYRREGLLGAADSERIAAMIREKLQFPEIVSWFSPGIEVLNERDIITAGETYRPDRVMVDGKHAIVADYKFGDQELTKFERQLTGYKKLLQELGYTQVEGYIWYVMLNKLVKV